MRTPRLSRRWFFFALLTSGFWGAPVLACLWDTDTLAMERQRFPSALELITGKFLRHSPAFYEWRVKDRLAKIEGGSGELAHYDDLAVAYDKLGRHDEAVATIRKKDALSPGLYETEANLGTFLIHGGQLEEGLVHIKRAIEINPEAHFGREVYQQLLVEYVLSKRGEDGELSLPLGGRGGRSAHDGSHGFAGFVASRLQERPGEAAVKGVLGMMRFGNHDSPILLEALGDLLMAGNQKADGRLLAARAYYKAGKETKQRSYPAAKGYRDMANAILQPQQIVGVAEQDVPAKVEQMLDQEIAEAAAWYAGVVADEAVWVAAGVDVDAAFAEKYYKEPANASSFKLAEWSRAHTEWVVNGVLIVFLIVCTIFVRLLLRWSRRRKR